MAPSHVLHHQKYACGQFVHSVLATVANALFTRPKELWKFQGGVTNRNEKKGAVGIGVGIQTADNPLST